MVDDRALKLARSAREQLGEALGTLQMEELPLPLFDVTAQVAKAMSLLLRFEQEGDGRIAEQALLAVRTTLGVLQTCNPRVPAVEKSAGAVAGALGLVHSVNELAALPRAAVPVVNPKAELGRDRGQTQIGYSAPVLSADHTDTVKEPLSGRGSSDAMRAIKAAAPGASEVNTARSAAAAAPAPQAALNQAALRKETLAGAGPDAVKSAAPSSQPSSASSSNNAIPISRAASSSQRLHAVGAREKHEADRRAAREQGTQPEPLASVKAPKTEARPEHPAPKTGPRGTVPVLGAGRNANLVHVSLGAHSASNFFAGLAGLNVVDKGGLFIATYEVAAVGQQLQVCVALPGGHEFEADVVVLWQREPARNTTPGLPPGYGVKFTKITEAGRKLIERYVAHREPFFYDEL